ncbi:MAG: hypothetical protein AAFP97_10730, partial [Pseudomonadota bacterium]
MVSFVLELARHRDLLGKIRLRLKTFIEFIEIRYAQTYLLSVRTYEIEMGGARMATLDQQIEQSKKEVAEAQSRIAELS